MSKLDFPRFDRLLKAMMAGPSPSMRKRDEQSQRTREGDSRKKPETPGG
jgi:hypothetical protein